MLIARLFYYARCPYHLQCQKEEQHHARRPQHSYGLRHGHLLRSRPCAHPIHPRQPFLALVHEVVQSLGDEEVRWFGMNVSIQHSTLSCAKGMTLQGRHSCGFGAGCRKASMRVQSRVSLLPETRQHHVLMEIRFDIAGRVLDTQR